MSWTSPQRKLLNEGEFDSHELIEYKIQTALQKAEELEGWDFFSTPRQQNIFLRKEDLRTVTSRFWEEDVAMEWASLADGDRMQVGKNRYDERFHMPYYMAIVTYFSPEYEERIEESHDHGSQSQ